MCSCKEGEEVIAKCSECDDFLCILCFYAHSRLKISRNHSVTLFNSAVLSSKKPNVKRKSVRIGVKPHTRNKFAQCNIRHSPTMVTQRALSSDKKCRQFHGIKLKIFNQIFLGLEEKFGFVKSHKLAPKDQLSIFYHKLKANADNTELSIIYGAGEDLISKVFKHMVSVLFEFSKKYIWWLSRCV